MGEFKVLDEIYEEYLAELSLLDLGAIQGRLGVEIDGDAALVPFYGVPYRVSPSGITDGRGARPSHSVSVVLCKYLLLSPDSEPTDTGWVTYREFKDAGPFVAGFAANAERPIGRLFSGRLPELERAAAAYSGHPSDMGVSCDLAVRFDALPRVPLAMLFNDRDEDFPAQCSLLFQKSAAKYLDMECLAIVGWALAEWLQRSMSNTDQGE